MRLLVFEYITGGGLINQPLPTLLLQEAYLMRNALLDDLESINHIEVLVLLDERVMQCENTENSRFNYLTIDQKTDLIGLLTAQQSRYDAVWLIAPETDGILARWCHFFTQQSKLLMTSGQLAVEICQDKLATFRHLQQAGIPCIPSQRFNPSMDIKSHMSVVKVNDSVGCDEVFLLESEEHWKKVLVRLAKEKQYIIQPYIAGENLSLSCLFYQGQAYFICCNQQHIHIKAQQFVLSACTVNVHPERWQQYQLLCQQVADSMPQLFGFVGIDIIQMPTGETLIIEINPRLTTSFAGIKQALGLNVAACVIDMIQGIPLILNKTKNQQVYIDINQGACHAS